MCVSVATASVPDVSNFENAKDIVAIIAAPASVIAGAWFAARSSAKQLEATNDDRARERDHAEKVRAAEASERVAAAEAERRANEKRQARQRHEDAQEGALIATAALRGEIASSVGNRHNEDTEVVRRFMEATSRFTLELGESETAKLQNMVTDYISGGTNAPDWAEIDKALGTYSQTLATYNYWDPDDDS